MLCRPGARGSTWGPFLRFGAETGRQSSAETMSGSSRALAPCPNASRGPPRPGHPRALEESRSLRAPRRHLLSRRRHCGLRPRPGGLGSRPLGWGAGEESEIPGELRGADLWGAGGEDEWGCKVKRPVRWAETPPTEEGTAEGTERARLRQRPAAGTPRQRRGAGPLPTASPGAGRQRRSGTGSSVRDGDHRIGTPRSLFAALSGGGRRPPLPRDGKPLPKAPLLGGPSDEAGPPPRPGRLLHPSLPGVGPPAPQLRHLVERRANSSESF